MTSVFNDIVDSKLLQLIAGGSIGVLPTDTLYGVVCSASNKRAVTRLYALKSRERKPGTIIAANIDQLVALGIKKRYLKAVEHYWPGPVSIVVPTETSMNYLDQGLGTLAVRVVVPSPLAELLLSCGPLLTSSANMPGLEPANAIVQANDYFGEKVDFYVDGGDLSTRQPSTLIRIFDDTVEVLRQGSGIVTS